MNRSTLLLKLSLLSDPKLLCAVRAAVGEVTVMFGFRDAEVRSIVLAVDEALANVIRHAYHGAYDRPIQVSFYRDRVKTGEGVHDALKIQIVDRGNTGRFRTTSWKSARRYSARRFGATLHP